MQNEKIIVKVRIQDGEFVECTGAQPRMLEKYLVMVNGWECTFFPDGALKCSTFLGDKASKDDVAFLKISSKGYYSFIIRQNGYDRILKKFKLDKWPDNGSLVLVTRDNGKVNATFQDERYEAFMKRYGLTIIKRENPDGFYRIHEYFWKDEGHRHAYTTIQTDGELMRSTEEVLTLDTYQYVENFYDVEVKGATWVILTIYDTNHDEPLSTLYTKIRSNYLNGRLPERKTCN